MATAGTSGKGANRQTATLTQPIQPVGELTADPIAAIVEAAARCFARWGIQRTRVEDIAIEVGLARPHVYRYFASKDAIVHAVVLRQIRHHHRRLAERFPHKGPAADLIVGSLVCGIHDAANDPDVQFLIGGDATNVTARSLTSSPEVLAELRTHWVPLLEYALGRGELRAGLDLGKAARFLIHIQLSYLALPEMVPPRAELEEDLRAFVLPALIAPDGEKPR
ncbi:regulatory protein TetR [Mycolicibacterium rhodesiae JS60]|nr:regulatory protein TetR [Mycolicibacterium rhodesiae JS60]